MPASYGRGNGCQHAETKLLLRHGIPDGGTIGIEQHVHAIF